MKSRHISAQFNICWAAQSRLQLLTIMTVLCGMLSTQVATGKPPSSVAIINCAYWHVGEIIDKWCLIGSMASLMSTPSSCRCAIITVVQCGRAGQDYIMLGS